MIPSSENHRYTLQEILSAKSLPALDGFRMIAVMAVVFAHAGISTLFTARHGVAGFFVLSGFLITWLLLREFEKYGTISFKKFYARRSLRIFPAYYAFVFVSISWDLYRGNSEIEPLIWPSFFYWVNYYNAVEGHPSTSVAHLWSLGVEEQFYLVFPFLFYLLMRRGLRQLVIGLGALILLSMMWRSTVVTVLGWDTSYAYNAFDTRFDNLAIGCLMAVLLHKPSFRHFVDPLLRYRWAPLATAALLALSREIPSTHYEYGPAFTIDAILLGLLLLQLMSLSRTGFWSFMNWRPVVYVGLISYPIYLWHGWALQAGAKLNVMPTELQLIAGVFLCIVAGAASYEIIEKPFLRLKKRFTVVEAERTTEGSKTMGSALEKSGSGA